MPAQTRSYLCHGCHRPFTTFRGYRSHLHQSRDPLCQQVRRQISKLNGSNGSESGSSVASDTESEDDSIPFAGDAFGTPADYQNDLFGQEEAEAGAVPVQALATDAHADEFDEEASEADEAEAEMIAELEADWEPNRQGAPAAQPAVDTNTMDVDEDAAAAAPSLEEI